MVTNNTILLNDSMVKLVKYFDDIKEYRNRLDNLEPKYRKLLTKLYITKVNVTRGRFVRHTVKKFLSSTI